MRRGTNLPAVGTFNHTVVLDAIRRNTEPVSRKEISATTGLALQTVRNAVEKLLADGLITEAGKRINGPGKPEMLFELNSEGRFALGVHLDPTIITYVVLDLRGRIVAESMMHMPPEGEPEEIIATIGAALDRLIDDSGVDRTRILGIGIATPGPLDPANGVILDPPLLPRWRNVPVRDALSAATGFPVILEGGPTAAAIAELWLGGAVAHDDFVFFFLGSGIGFGLVLDGQVRRGSSGNAGSGGTLFVPVDGLGGGRRVDMLGRLATPQFVVAQAVADGVVDKPVPENDTTAIERQFDRLLALADGGDGAAVRILDRAADLIATALVSTVNVLDMEEIIFGGPFWARVEERFLPRIAAIVDHSPDRETRHPIRMSSSKVHGDVVAIGAACLVLDDTLSPRPTDLLITV
ncbi:ROK family protein [Diaminobutyricibacter sp. McL0618]|uniref:ROK family protein n=1 Tax=Leifsonia sp. McL0618 TaxID=3415677 RepID=UPI003CEC6F61